MLINFSGPRVVVISPFFIIAVDFRTMLTFLEFYECFLKFVLFKLFNTIDLRYPPLLDSKMDEAGAHLSALRAEGLEEANGEGDDEGGDEEEEPESMELDLEGCASIEDVDQVSR